jgi:hypothetical protein
MVGSINNTSPANVGIHALEFYHPAKVNYPAPSTIRHMKRGTTTSTSFPPAYKK